jgi:DNA primase
VEEEVEQDGKEALQQRLREAAAEQAARTQQEASKHPFLARPNPSRLAQAALAERQLLEQTSTEPRGQLVAYRHLERSCRCLLGLAQEQQPHQVGQQDQRHPLAQCSKEHLAQMEELEQARQQRAQLLARVEQGREAVFQHQQPLDLLAGTAELLYPLGSLADLETEAQSQATEVLHPTSRLTSHCALEVEAEAVPASRQMAEMEEMVDYTEVAEEAEERLLMG